MGSSGFFKGEKKKQKKDKSNKNAFLQQGAQPSVFVMPEVIKKKKEY